MFEPEVFRATVAKLTHVLRSHGIRFHITGGITSIAYGEPRMTQDVDLVVDNAALSANLGPFVASLSTTDFLHSEEEIREAIISRGMFQLMDSVESLKLDVYARELIPGELDRSQEAELFEGEILPIASHVDTLLSKLVWISQGSHKSRRDLRFLHRGVNQDQGEFIATMAEQLGLSELLAEVLSESEGPSQ